MDLTPPQAGPVYWLDAGDIDSSRFPHGQQSGSRVIVYLATHTHEGYALEVGGGGQLLGTVFHPAARSGNDWWSTKVTPDH